MQAATPSPEQQWDNMMGRVVERANGIPDTRALKIDVQEGLLLLQRLKDQMVGARDEEIKIWKEKVQKLETSLKEREAEVGHLNKELEKLRPKSEVQPKPEGTQK